jgi:hypothetical protein
MRGSNVAQVEALMAVSLGPSAFGSQALSIFDDLLAAVARQSDVCDLFQHLSAAVCRIIPYDEAQLVLLTEAGSILRYARTLRRTLPGVRSDVTRNDSRRPPAASTGCGL